MYFVLLLLLLALLLLANKQLVKDINRMALLDLLFVPTS